MSRAKEGGSTEGKGGRLDGECQVCRVQQRQGGERRAVWTGWPLRRTFLLAFFLRKVNSSRKRLSAGTTQ